MQNVWFNPDGRRLYMAGADDSLRCMELTRNDWKHDELVLASELLAGHTLHPSGSLIPMDPTGIRRSLSELRNRFAIADGNIAAWHQREATECASRGQWMGAIWHLERQLIHDPMNPHAHARRADAFAEMSQWARAAADYSKAIELGLTDGQLRLRRDQCDTLSRNDVIFPAGSEWKWLHPADGVDPARDNDAFHATFF